MQEAAQLDLGEDTSLLLVDDDEPFLRRLAKAMEKRGFSVETAESVAAGKAIATARPPAYAVVDLRLEDGNGLDVVEVLREKRPDVRVVVLTGYGAIATAVAAVKIGATDYLSKPADAADIVNALLARGDDLPPPPENPMSADRVRWEHIQRVFELCDRNVSETARRLNMHRRTLQRILAKVAPHNGAETFKLPVGSLGMSGIAKHIAPIVFEGEGNVCAGHRQPFQRGCDGQGLRPFGFHEFQARRCRVEQVPDFNTCPGQAGSGKGCWFGAFNPARLNEHFGCVFTCGPRCQRHPADGADGGQGLAAKSHCMNV